MGAMKEAVMPFYEPLLDAFAESHDGREPTAVECARLWEEAAGAFEDASDEAEERLKDEMKEGGR